MDCPNCGTYNPEDRDTCWRCDKELPKPVEKNRRDSRKSAQTWLYIAIAAFVIFTLIQTCGVFQGGDQGQGGPSGYQQPRAAVAYRLAAEELL